MRNLAYAGGGAGRSKGCDSSESPRIQGGGEGRGESRAEGIEGLNEGVRATTTVPRRAPTRVLINKVGLA